MPGSETHNRHNALKPCGHAGILVFKDLSMGIHGYATSILASERHLKQQSWWPEYERTRPARSRLNDILFLGHFCSWLSERGLSPADCTLVDLRAYDATLETFRDGVRLAYARAAHDLVDFLATTQFRAIRHPSSRSQADSRQAPADRADL
jgi:hypothetical protein